ncbi:MAG: DUF1565 domain-containing protein [Deltaproteobacteria bacterium]|nr:MAG: DUF1565 domain-containing protein [Deltaproteobacteria bacterium]
MENMYKEALGDTETSIWVAIGGNDDINTGKFDSPYASIAKAIAACTTARHDIHVMPGAYTHSDDADITINGTKIVGVGAVSINCSGCTTYGFKTVFGAATGTKEVTFKNLSINAGAKVGIQLDNVGATAKVNCYLYDVEIYNTSNSYSAVDVDHTVVAGQGIRLYAYRCIFKGKIDVVVGDNGDRFRFKYCELRGGLVSSAADYDAEFAFLWTEVLLAGITGGHANQRAIVGACITETNADPNVYLGAVAGDVATQTEQLITFPGA